MTHDIKALADAARQGWRIADESGTEDYDELWAAAAAAVAEAITAKPVTARDEQVGGAHYKNKEVQPWDAMESWMTPEAFQGFLLGSAIAYLARVSTTGVAGKGGRLDVQKARHYLTKLLEVMPNVDQQ